MNVINNCICRFPVTCGIKTIQIFQVSEYLKTHFQTLFSAPQVPNEEELLKAGAARGAGGGRRVPRPGRPGMEIYEL